MIKNSFQQFVQTLELIKKESKPSVKQKIITHYLKNLDEDEFLSVLYILDPHIREKKLINVSTRTLESITNIHMPEINYNFDNIKHLINKDSTLMNNSLLEPNKIVIKNAIELVKLVTKDAIDLKCIQFYKGFNSVEWIPLIFTVLKLLEGVGSRKKKEEWILHMLKQYNSLEGLYLIRILLNNIRVGLKNNLLLKPIAEVKNLDINLVKRVYNTTPILLNIFKGKGIEIGLPIKPMLLKFCKKSILSKINYENYVYEYKFDGLRVQIHFKDGKLNIFSRNLLNLTSAVSRYIERELSVAKLENCILDGELCGVDFQTITQVIMRKHEKQSLNLDSFKTSLKLFDILLLEERELLNVPYIERKKILKEYLDKMNVNCYVDCYEMDELLFTKILDKSFNCDTYEGFVLKEKLSEYTPNERSNKWIKVKPHCQEVDAVILEGMQGTGIKSNYYSSFNLGLKNNLGEIIEVGQIGSGFSISDLDYIKEIYGPIERVKKFNPPLVIKVEFQDLQKSTKYNSGYSLRFPIFKGFRLEKTIEDIDSIQNYD
jgi:DNA ligase-1